MHRNKIEFFFYSISAFLLGSITVLYATQARDMESILIALAMLLGTEFLIARALLHVNEWSKSIPEPHYPDLDAPVIVTTVR